MRLEGQIAALTADAAFENGDYKTRPTKGRKRSDRMVSFRRVSAATRVVARDRKAGMKHDQLSAQLPDGLLSRADANDLILQMRTWKKHDVGTTPGFNVMLRRTAIN